VCKIANKGTSPALGFVANIEVNVKRACAFSSIDDSLCVSSLKYGIAVNGGGGFDAIQILLMGSDHYEVLLYIRKPILIRRSFYSGAMVVNFK
jgi:hypothetical protein